AEDGIRDFHVTGVQTCALPILPQSKPPPPAVVELLEEVDVDLVLCPVGGGGLLCGTAVAAKTMRSKIKVVAAEPANADDAAQSRSEERRVGKGCGSRRWRA